MMADILEKVLYVGSTVIVSFVTFLMGKKKQAAETDSTTLQNLEKSLLIYQKMIDDMGNKIDDLTVKIEELESHLDRLIIENKQLKRKIKI
jgi:peptidoglycan hydrolase CwlO-like protein